MKTVWSVIAALVLFTATAFPAVRIFETNVVVETFAGSGFVGNVDGVALETMFNDPTSLDIDEQGTVFVLDSGIQTIPFKPAIRQITPARAVTTITSFGTDDDFYGDKIRVFHGSTFLSHGGNQVFRLNDIALEVLIGASFSMPGGGAIVGGYKDGPALSAEFQGKIRFDISNTGEFWLADDNRRIRKMDASKNVQTVAGSGNRGHQDGTGIFCSFGDILAITVAPSGDLFVIDDHMIRRVSQSFKVTTVAGADRAGYEDGPGAEARFNAPHGIAVDAGGNVYVADSGNNAIRKIRPDGFVVTLVEKLIRDSRDLKVATDGSLFIADTGNLIRKMSFAPTAPLEPQELSANLYAGITISGKVGQGARIEYTGAVGGAWKPLTTVTLDKTPFLWFDSDSPNHSKRFYRSVILP